MSPVFLPSKFCVFYHTDCLEVILLVAEEYFLVRVLCFFSLLSQSSCLFFGKLGSLGRSLIVHVFSSVSWGYHRWGYGFGLVSVGTGGPSYDVEALTAIVRQGDEIILLKIGPLVRFRSIDFSQPLVCSKTKKYLFISLLVVIWEAQVALLVVRTSLSLFSLRREASERQFLIEKKVRTRKRTIKIHRTAEQQMSLDLRSEKWHKSLEILQHHDHVQAPALLQASLQG